MRRRDVLIGGMAALGACQAQQKNQFQNSQPLNTETYDSFSEDFLKLIKPDEKFTVLGDGYGWSEGPAWDKKRNCLYFTDVPGNVAYRWSKTNGIETFLKPSGAKAVTGFREPGANGLLYLADGNLLLCNHGTRSVELFNPDTKSRRTITNLFEGKKFNSPNDIIMNDKGQIFFTDPPYGLEGLDSSPLKEQNFNGVYRYDKDAGMTALIRDMTFPNGIALSPNQKTLYISQSDPKAPHLYRLDLTEDGAQKELLVDFSKYMNDQSPGLPDGMALDHLGNIFVTGPGGVFIVTSTGQVLGRIKTGKGSANCTFGENGQTLFITNHDRLIKLKTNTSGLI